MHDSRVSVSPLALNEESISCESKIQLVDFSLSKKVFMFFLIFVIGLSQQFREQVRRVSSLASFPSPCLSQLRLAGSKRGPACKHRANLTAKVNVCGNTGVATRHCYDLSYLEAVIVINSNLMDMIG